jgi:hypothetical protein
MALKDKSTLSADKDTAYPDNTGGAITPAIMRPQVQDEIDSFLNLAATQPEQEVAGPVDFTGGIKKDGVEILPLSYFKTQVLSNVTSPNFSSNTPVDIPDLSFTITQDGDYVLYGIVNHEINPDSVCSLFFAKNGVTITDSEASSRQKKNNVENVQTTYLETGLVIGDVITVRMDTENDTTDLGVRRFLLQSWA